MGIPTGNKGKGWRLLGGKASPRPIPRFSRLKVMLLLPRPLPPLPAMMDNLGTKSMHRNETYTVTEALTVCERRSSDLIHLPHLLLFKEGQKGISPHPPAASLTKMHYREITCEIRQQAFYIMLQCQGNNIPIRSYFTVVFLETILTAYFSIVGIFFISSRFFIFSTDSHLSKQ